MIIIVLVSNAQPERLNPDRLSFHKSKCLTFNDLQLAAVQGAAVAADE